MLFRKGGATRGAGRKERQKDTIRRWWQREWQGEWQGESGRDGDRAMQWRSKPDGEFTRERKVNSWPNAESSAAPCEARRQTHAHAGMRGTAGLVCERERERGSHSACVVPIPGRTASWSSSPRTHGEAAMARHRVCWSYRHKSQTVIGSCWLIGGIALAGWGPGWDVGRVWGA
ncbi:hypothetical protein V2W45_1350366 [Cenococcum geophilum]